ncbi:T9SS type A sorting domain-containing protein [Jejuia pallidilutea]|jgi:hypothetical protein|uniref:Gll1663 protein n=2 Tax=Jejuia pallidilutea TaxID=504487 RepID=A0A090WBR5_9FLAO|nr:T9SS type A sorting domain-containing protein [Jejuia pallidilutea]GAL72884.1 Gll1663 protein [Jejuia pallidilutea]GAL90318.1 Gll1663 protein [Jejuia pallidilutea]
MKKITYFTLFLLFIFTPNVNAQVIAWSSDLEDLTGWGIQDLDMDGNNWGFFSGGAESFGFTGAFALSASWIPEPEPNGTALTPDNLLFTPTFPIPSQAVSISFKMKVISTNATFFAEKYAVLVYDDADFENSLISVFEETLTEGGPGTAKDINVTIPNIFAGKTLGIIIRHYDCTDEVQMLVDDFEVSYTTSLSTQDNTLEITKAFPNPVKDKLTIKTNETIEKVTVTNQLGQRVLIIKKNDIFDNTINLSSLNKGLYMVRVEANNKSSVLKISKE